MKVLLVSDHAAPAGGAELLMLRIRQALRNRGHDARLFSTSARPAGLESLADYECHGTTSPARLLVRTANVSALRQLRRVLADFRPDVAHVGLFLNQLSPLILGPLASVPSIYHVLWYRPICPIGTKLRPDGAFCNEPPGTVCYRAGCVPLLAWGPAMLQMRLWRRSRGSFDAIVACSEAVRRRLLAEDIEPVELIRHGVPVRPPRPALTGPPTVAFAGRLRAEKGADVLVQAFAEVTQEIPDARLVLFGDGVEAGRLAALVGKLGLTNSVALQGHLSSEELERQLGTAWVQAVPGRWEDPLPLVSLEAMMRGTAVVASGVGGVVEVVQQEVSGLLVPPADPSALAAALVRLLGDRGLAERMGAAGREYAVAKLDEERLVDDFVALYERLTSEREPTAGAPSRAAGT